jgi:hypothetical protein
MTMIYADSGLTFSGGNLITIVPSIPTTGSYTAGDIVLESSSTYSNPSGWKRLTTGSSHVLGTDWKYFGGLVSMVRVNGPNGAGSTNTSTRRFTNITNGTNGCVIQGTDITFADSATLGDTFTINTSGTYSISYSDQFAALGHFGVTLNDTNLTARVNASTADKVLVAATTPGASQASTVTWTGYLAAGSVIRANAGLEGNGGNTVMTQFTITKVG